MEFAVTAEAPFVADVEYCPKLEKVRPPQEILAPAMRSERVSVTPQPIARLRQSLSLRPATLRKSFAHEELALTVSVSSFISVTVKSSEFGVKINEIFIGNPQRAMGPAWLCQVANTRCPN
jgi:hypothetical protein